MNQCLEEWNGYTLEEVKIMCLLTVLIFPTIKRTRIFALTKPSQPEKNGHITQAAKPIGTQEEGTSDSTRTHPTTRMDHQSKKTIRFHQSKTNPIILIIPPLHFKTW